MYKCICSSSVFVLDRSSCPQIFQEFKSTDIKYKTRLRSRISNLKDQKNPDLRRNVLCGNISPHRIASMTAEVRRADVLSHCYLLEGFACVMGCFRVRISFKIRLVDSLNVSVHVRLCVDEGQREVFIPDVFCVLGSDRQKNTNQLHIYFQVKKKKKKSNSRLSFLC